MCTCCSKGRWAKGEYRYCIFIHPKVVQSEARAQRELSCTQSRDTRIVDVILQEMVRALGGNTAQFLPCFKEGTKFHVKRKQDVL